MLPTCQVPTCKTTVARNGLCLAHLGQAIAQQAARNAARSCTADGCSNDVRANGLCSGHDTRRRRGQDLSPLAVHPDHCTAPGCERPHYAKGLCRSDYEKERRAARAAA